MKKNLFSLSLAIFALVGSLAHSQVREKPLVQTEIQADRFQGKNDGETAYLLFEGNVELTATNMKITCSQLEVYSLLKNEDSDQPQGKVAIGVFSSIEKIIASGGVTITQDERFASADSAEVQPNEERIVLSGTPIIRQNGYEFSNPGGSLVIDRGAGQISTLGANNRRVRLIGPPIGDLGFEPVEDPEVTPEEGETSENADQPEDSPAEASEEKKEN